MNDSEKISSILKENDRRNAAIFCRFNPITGEGSVGRRVKVRIAGFPILSLIHI
mgnify:CR=1 FL=1